MSYAQLTICERNLHTARLEKKYQYIGEGVGGGSDKEQTQKEEEEEEEKTEDEPNET